MIYSLDTSFHTKKNLIMAFQLKHIIIKHKYYLIV